MKIALISIAALIVFPTSQSFGQGSLLPPPGPPSPTMKALDQVEPRTIVNAANTPGDAANTRESSARQVLLMLRQQSL